MGNIQNFIMTGRPAERSESSCLKADSNYIPVEYFTFHGIFEVNSTNGLCFNDIYIPEEVISNILKYIHNDDVLSLTLVCKKWCNIIKSNSFWINKYNNCYADKAKNLPWYVYYSYFTTNNFKNLIKNGNGQEKFGHWKIVKNYGDQFRVENPPVGSDPLPVGVPEFYGHTSCFATSYQECNKYQKIDLQNKRLLQYIIRKYKPNIYASEWVAGRFDCGCKYKFGVCGYFADPNSQGWLEYHDSRIMMMELDHNKVIKSLFFPVNKLEIEQWRGKDWNKLEILIDEYPTSVNLLIFEHEGRDTQFWKGHYGCKMAGSVLRFEFDSIQPSQEQE